jgi:UDP-2,3-diacylglucosamine pyrophosphatase LpxH
MFESSRLNRQSQSQFGSLMDDLGPLTEERPAMDARTKTDLPLLGGALRGPWEVDEEDPEPKAPKRRYRTIWISDIHLGTTGCNADLLVDFLKAADCETLYLVGDIIDGWRLKRSWYWHSSHNDVVRRILKKAKKGTRVVYIPGNHDEALRPYVGLNLGGVELLPEAIHETADGKKLLILHGDEFDSVVLYARWLAFLGDYAYVLLLKVNTAFNSVRRRFGLPYWSLSAYLKKKVKNAVEYVSRYEYAVVHAASQRGVDGVVCGHIHSAEISQFGDVTYCNDGDWVESCTALVEHFDGRLEILHWADEVRERMEKAIEKKAARKARAAA